jgi:hypothetical protein
LPLAAPPASPVAPARGMIGLRANRGVPISIGQVLSAPSVSLRSNTQLKVTVVPYNPEFAPYQGF